MTWSPRDEPSFVGSGLDQLEQARTELLAMASGAPDAALELPIRLRAVEILLDCYAREAWQPGGVFSELTECAPWLRPRIDAHCRRLARASTGVARLASFAELAASHVERATVTEAAARLAGELRELSSEEGDMLFESDEEPPAQD